jgi:hypothetical protein
MLTKIKIIKNKIITNDKHILLFLVSPVIQKVSCTIDTPHSIISNSFERFNKNCEYSSKNYNTNQSNDHVVKYNNCEYFTNDIKKLIREMNQNTNKHIYFNNVFEKKLEIANNASFYRYNIDELILCEFNTFSFSLHQKANFNLTLKNASSNEFLEIPIE